MFNFFRKDKKNTRRTLFYTTDLHSHVIPGIDDGSPDVETSIQLIGKMQEWGITKIISTPHIADATFENNKTTIGGAYDKLKVALCENNIDVDISYSAEYRMDEGFLNKMEAGELIPLPGNRILIENSFFQPFWNIKGLIFDLELKGFFPILAHPERYAYYFEDKSIYTELHEMGCKFQVNLLSLSGFYGKEVLNVALWLLKQDYIDYIGTDLHHMKHVEGIEEFLSGSAYPKIAAQLEKRILNNELR